MEVLGRNYPSSGRPDSITVTSDFDQIKRLKRQGYYHIAWRNNEYSVEKAWREFTFRDSAGFSQWRR